MFCLGRLRSRCAHDRTTATVRWLAASNGAAGTHGRDALRFGIQHVMIWTGLLAVLFGVFRYLVQHRYWLWQRGWSLPRSFCWPAAMSVSTGGRRVGDPVETDPCLHALSEWCSSLVFAVSLTRFLSDEWMFTLSAVPASQVLVMADVCSCLRMDRFRFLKRNRRAEASLGLLNRPDHPSLFRFGDRGIFGSPFAKFTLQARTVNPQAGGPLRRCCRRNR